MSILYDLYRNPPREGDKEEQPLHARVVSYGKVSGKRLMELAGRGCTFSPEELRGAMGVVVQTLIEELRNGKVVEIEGLGTFSLSLKCPPVMNKKEIRSVSVDVKTVTFRPSKELKQAVGKASLRRNPSPSHSVQMDADERENLLAVYFKEHLYLKRTAYQRLRKCTRSKALIEINELIAQGKLKKEGQKGSTLYFPGSVPFASAKTALPESSEKETE